MSEAADLLTFVARKLASLLGGRFLEHTMVAVLLVALEAWLLRSWRRYASRTFLADLGYYLFFTAGFYYFLISGPIDRAVKALVAQHLPSLTTMNLLSVFPWWLHALLLVAIIDGIEYGLHRLGHSNRLYWKFHCIHHSAEQLTPFTKFRVHFLDMTVYGTVKVVPLIALGLPADRVMPYLALMSIQMISHYDVGWTYGGLGKIFVSPAFHRVHHSADPKQCQTNFGIIFSFWDYLFGTAAADLARPAAYGIAGLKVPQSFFRQFFFPFLLVAQELRLRRPPAVAAKAEPS